LTNNCEALGHLVRLSYSISGCSPAAYPRRHLRRAFNWEISSPGEFRT
jgi:hypothetical protein